jgi:PEP-CTERM motif
MKAKTALRIVTLAVLAHLSNNSATAGVIYRWTDVDPKPADAHWTGYIEFAYDTWSDGGHLLVGGSIPFPGARIRPFTGIERFIWEGTESTLPEGFNLTQRPCSEHTTAQVCEASGLTADSPLLADWNSDRLVSGRVDVDFGPVLTGDLYFGLMTSTLRMHSSGPLWSIDVLASDRSNDRPGGCNGPPRCVGGTGLWVLDLSSLPPVSVPEPGTLGLFGLGVLGVGLTRRRRSCER